MSIKKIVVIGPESTGKSTLSEALSKSFDTVWVGEYAREYLEGLGREYIEDDLVKIAKCQLRAEDEFAANANRVLICDTDLYVVKVWSEAKYGYCDKWVLEQIALREYDLYLLTYIDVIWEDDPLREHPALHERQYFYSQYLDIVQNSGVPFVEIKGDMETRLQMSIDAIKAVF